MIFFPCTHSCQVRKTLFFVDTQQHVLFHQEEKEKVRAQKEEVLNQMNDVLENELQCTICSEHFIEVCLNLYGFARKKRDLRSFP